MVSDIPLVSSFSFPWEISVTTVLLIPPIPLLAPCKNRHKMARRKDDARPNKRENTDDSTKETKKDDPSAVDVGDSTPAIARECPSDHEEGRQQAGVRTRVLLVGSRDQLDGQKPTVGKDAYQLP